MGEWRSKFEITLSSPDVLAAEDFEQSNLIYDDSGEFDADISGMLCESVIVECGDACGVWAAVRCMEDEQADIRRAAVRVVVQIGPPPVQFGFT